MVRTQIYLTKGESAALLRLSKASGQGKSEMIRRAVDEFIARHEGEGRLQRLQAARGMWKNRRDIPDVRKMREEFDRF